MIGPAISANINPHGTGSTRMPISAACSRPSTPKARDDLRRVLIRDQADRDAISSNLMRYREERGDDWADIIDMLMLHRMLGGKWCG